MIDIIVCVAEEHKREVTLGFYSHSNPRVKLPKTVRIAKLNDLRGPQGPKIGTPFLFQKRGGGYYYATKINSYGVDWQLEDAVKEQRVWVLK